jgi:hypothetical protein
MLSSMQTRDERSACTAMDLQKTLLSISRIFFTFVPSLSWQMIVLQ